MTNIFNNATLQITLSKEQLKELLRKQVEESYPGLSVEGVNFRVETQTDMRGEVYAHDVKEVSIRLKPKSAGMSY